MGTEKRERQRAAREAKATEEAVMAKKSRRVRTAVTVAIVVGVALLAAFAYSAIFGGNGNGDDDPAEDPDDEAPVEDVPEADDAEDPDDEGDDENAEAEDEATVCPAEDGSSPREVTFSEAPPMCIDPSLTYIAEVVTDRGEFEITLDAAAAPVAVNNFVFLARWHYYDGLEFHRVVPGTFAQAGNAGPGSPGYQVGDVPGLDGELPDDEPYYPVMSVAMANVGGDPTTTGAQFFIVTGPGADGLPASYLRFGQVTDQEDVVMEIDAGGSDSGEPEDPVVIESVTIVEAG